MVVGAFPAVKLAVLAFKQLSKPIANIMKERAKSHPFFRKYICMPPAQFYNWVEVQTRMWVLNLGKPVKIPQLNETQAIELGANLLGETIIYSIGAGLLIFEYKRQSNKETAREEMAIEEQRELQFTLQELALNIERQDAQIRHLQRTVAELESRTWLPKIKILGTNKDDDDDNKPPEPTPPPPTPPIPTPQLETAGETSAQAKATPAVIKSSTKH
ncbi:putative OPA3-like protein CG13603 isoform X2 [Contarinia nasturtii]|uniref:putative OPA3-like protein CG13603 isoform X2 n=1 Tax=Contarinia nasturtii TaxID=265458 RepID=UPI0012D39BC2|nr:putative OPA3-like protein CG13603 isoform X2 [Contarinia nasturtii]